MRCLISITQRHSNVDCPEDRIDRGWMCKARELPLVIKTLHKDIKPSHAQKSVMAFSETA